MGIAAFAEPVYVLDRTSGEYKTTTEGGVWYTCSRRESVGTGAQSVAQCFDTADPSIECASYLDHARAVRAFYVMLMAVLVFSLLAWALAISFARTAHCDTRAFVDQPGFGWGPSPFLLIVVTLISIGQIVVALIVPGRSEADSKA